MTTPQPTRQVRRALYRQSRKSHKSQETQTQQLTDQILQEAQTKAAGAAAAAPVTQACLTEAQLHAWCQDLEARLQRIQQHPEQNLGHIEEELARSAKEPLRLLAQRAAQAKANATPCRCHPCPQELTQQKSLARTVDSRFGSFALWRRSGWCSHCEQWQFPADYALGLGRPAPASPYLQEISALLVSKMPAEQAVGVAERLGLDLSRCFLHREAHRQGLKAQERRAQAVAELDPWEDMQKLSRDAEGPPVKPFTLILEIDAWNIRERDHWGQTQELRQQGPELKRWHWVYLATVFRLEQRGQTAGLSACPHRQASAPSSPSGGMWRPEGEWTCLRVRTGRRVERSTPSGSDHPRFGPSPASAGHRRRRRLDLEPGPGPLWPGAPTVGPLPC